MNVARIDRSGRSKLAAVAALAVTAGAFGVAAGASGMAWTSNGEGFDHELHAGLFPSCLACHRGAAEAGAPLLPDPTGCASCHDGRDSLDVVDWTPREGPRATNLVFTHLEHAAEVADEGEPQPGCVECHAPEAAPWMTVERAVVSSCLSCHALAGEHFALADDTCAACHTNLADSPTLLAGQVASFSPPPSHEQADFTFEHGEVVDATCAVCHARDFCAQCHVNAPDLPAVVGLAPDSRSLALVAAVPEPPGHDAADFLSTHGTTAGATGSCASCHTAESCTTCHIGSPQVAAGLPPAGPDRGRGAVVLRDRPPSHDVDFLTAHGPVAASRPETCAGCHVRSDCTECHRPGAAAGGSFHPADFLSRHPSAAYMRETSCSSCHATTEFCTSCHASAGLGSEQAGGVLASSFHDGQAAFSVGHGAAARLNLETCASCHVERDCLACHSSTGGRGIDPHGPDFDAETLLRANPQMCTACHGSEVPTTP